MALFSKRLLTYNLDRKDDRVKGISVVCFSKLLGQLYLNRCACKLLQRYHFQSKRSAVLECRN